MKNYKNKGMFLEVLVEKTSNYYLENNLFAIFKRDVPIKIYKVEEQKVSAYLKQKALSDYYGVYHGKMFDFEAKQTQQKKFLLSNLKSHQYEHLKTIRQFGAFSFLLLHFVIDDLFFAIPIDALEKVINNNETLIDVAWCKKYGINLEIIFPGILNFKKFLETIYGE